MSGLEGAFELLETPPSFLEVLKDDGILWIFVLLGVVIVLTILMFAYTLTWVWLFNTGKIMDAPLFFAAKEGDSVAVAAFLRDDKMHPETPGVFRGWNKFGIGALLKAEAPLSWAAGGGHLDCVDLLVKAGASVERGSQLGPYGTVMKATPLFAAAHGGHLKVVKYLLEKGANPNLGWKMGPFGLITKVTPIARASENGFSDVVDALAEAGAKGASAYKNKGG